MLANIVSGVIIPLSALVGAFIATGGVFTSPRIIGCGEDDVAAAIRANGFLIAAHFHEEAWHCFACRPQR